MTIRIIRAMIYSQLREVSTLPITPKQMMKLLKANGFELVSSNGSHHKFKNPGTGKIVIVPVHSKDLKLGTEQNILKQAGLK